MVLRSPWSALALADSGSVNRRLVEVVTNYFPEKE